MNAKQYKEKWIKEKQEREERRKRAWENMKPFEDIEDIPELPVVNKDEWNNFYVPHLIRCGAIPKEKLEIDCFYKGSCRNATIAQWNGEKFIYERKKYNFKFNETINHFQDDDGHDLFVPLCKI